MAQEYREGQAIPASGTVGPILHGVVDGTAQPLHIGPGGELSSSSSDVVELLQIAVAEMRAIRRGLEMVLNTDLIKES